MKEFSLSSRWLGCQRRWWFQALSFAPSCSSPNSRRLKTRRLQPVFSRLPARNENLVDYSTFKSLEVHSKRGYKICICFVILEELEAFRNYKGFSFIFLKVWDRKLIKFISLSPRDIPRGQRHNLKDLTNKKQKGKYNIKIILFCSYTLKGQCPDHAHARASSVSFFKRQ